jgi:TPR repeat protein
MKILEPIIPTTLRGARESFVKAAELGHQKALLRIGLAYSNARKDLGFPLNIADSVHYLRLASSRGEPEADLQLSTLFGYGGADASPKPYLAHFHARLAAESGLAEGFYQLGTFFEFGMGVLENKKLACDLYQIAHSHGHKGSVRRIDQWVNLAGVRAYYRKAVVQKSQKS